MALRRQPIASASIRTPQQVQQAHLQQQHQQQHQQQAPGQVQVPQVQPAVVNSVFRSPEEINIPLQQRRPNFYQPTTARYESDEAESAADEEEEY